MEPCAIDYTRAFAAELVAMDGAALTGRDLAQLDRLLLDYCGVAFGGAARPWIAALHGWAQRYRGCGPARIIASDLEVPAEIAAFVNGAAGHSFELDDTHDSSMSHPGAVVIPAALAVASDVGADGPQVLAAIAAGYETMARIGIAVRAGRVIAAGFHPTAVLGVFGAATAAAKLLGFDAGQLCTAWGHALSLAAGSMQFSQEPAGAEVKRLHAGYAARSGVTAAQMAQAGISAPTRSLDGRYGFLALYGCDPDPAALLAPGARGLAIHDISIKPYACCRLLHSMIDGLRDATDGFTRGAEISRILVRGPQKLADQHMVARPMTPMAAQYSLPFAAGAALAYGPDRFDVFEDPYLADPDILGFADRVEVASDTELERTYPAHFGTEVEVSFADGQVRVRRVLDSIGTPLSPLPADRLAAKARALVAQNRADADFGRIEDAVRALARAGSVVSLQAALSLPPGSGIG
ncbi:MmgE/PrpD family protein [Xanthobacter wiegelii]|uniref:MmgE/PrpD family protein n=1 Tax=Xanthobacter wiegelii TaxID=3119913 RepID=UPI003729F6C9